MANTALNAHKPARELPISRSTSKLLEEVDKQLKNLTTDVRHTYGRYVDDFYLLAETKAEILNALPEIRAYLSDALRVTLHPLKVYLWPISHGMAFIGFYIKDGRIYTGNRTISHLYDLIRLQMDAKDKAFHVERFARRYNSLAGFLVHTYSYNIRCSAWYSIDQETKTYLEEPGWDFKKIQPLNQYTSITKIKNLYYAQSRFAKRRVG